MTTPHQPPLLREFIDIPEGMSDSDFVLKLAEGVTDAESTLRDYVITEDLVANFELVGRLRTLTGLSRAGTPVPRRGFPGQRSVRSH